MSIILVMSVEERELTLEKERELSQEEREHILEEREDTLEVEVLVKHLELGSSSSFFSLSVSADDGEKKVVQWEGVVETDVEDKGTGKVVALDVSGGPLLARVVE